MDVDKHFSILYSLCSIALVFLVFLEDDLYPLYIGTEIATSHLAVRNYNRSLPNSMSLTVSE